jgi:hypothetical protein
MARNRLAQVGKSKGASLGMAHWSMNRRVLPRTERGISVMTGAPVTDSGARKILLLLTAPHPRGMGLTAGGAAPEYRLRELFLGSADRNEADYDRAIGSLIGEGWVQRISTRVRLTEEGHKLCTASDMGDDQNSS